MAGIAGANCTDKEPDPLLNQDHYYAAYSFSSSSAAHDVAGCWFERSYSPSFDDYELFDSPLRTSMYLYQVKAQYGTVAQIIAVQGNCIIATSLSGGDGVTVHGVGIVEDIIEELGIPNR